MLVGVIAGAAHALDLLDDGVAINATPVIAGLDELLAADLETGDALVGKLLVYLGLGCDACMVGAKYPAGLITLHTRMTDAGILDGVIQGVAHMQHSRDIGRRDGNGVAAGAVLAETS